MQFRKILFCVLICFIHNFVSIAQLTFIQGNTGSIENNVTTNYYDLVATGLNSGFEVDGTKLSITHPDLPILSISLVSPNGTTVLLTENEATGTQFINTIFKRNNPNSIGTGTAPYTGFYGPIGNMDDFNDGQDLNGTWQLAISFTASVTTIGTLSFFDIAFLDTGTGSPICDPTTPTFADVDYVGNGDTKQFLDVYVPDGLTGAAPTVVYIHGGAFVTGSKGSAMDICEGLFCDHDYVIVDINYRLATDSIFPAVIYDAKTAIRFIKENAATYNIDTCRIGVIGESAGGAIASLLGTSMGEIKLEGLHLGSTTTTSDIHAVCDFFGSSDITQYDAFFDASCTSPLLQENPTSSASLLLGCDVSSTCTDSVMQAVNPITYINGNEPPFAIHHGTLDCVVPQHQSDILNDTLFLFGTDVTYTTHAGGGHGDFIDATVIGVMESFFNSKLNSSVCNYSTNCQNNMDIIAIPGDNTYSVVDTIKSTAIVKINDEVIYNAGVNICLDSGFETQVGADFLAAIQECGTTTPPTDNPMPAGESSFTIEQTIDGVVETRSVAVRAPDVLDPNAQYPLLFSFHGSGGSSAQGLNNSEFETIINTEGAIGVFPQGWNNVWNLGPENSNADEVEFVDLILAYLQNFSNIDFSRSYAFGNSNGAAMINKLAKERSHFNAIAPVVSQLSEALAPLDAPQAISVFQVNGDSDGLIPVNGGSSAVGQVFLSAQASAENWANESNCDVSPTTTSTDTWGSYPVNSYYYENCDNGHIVSYHILVGAGHTGTAGTDPNFFTRMWDFMKVQ